MKPRIVGRYRGEGRHKAIMWCVVGDTFWFYGLKYAIKASQE